MFSHQPPTEQLTLPWLHSRMTIYSLLPQRHSQTPQGQGWTVHGTEEVQEEKERRGHSLACSISATRQQGPACDLAAMAEETGKEWFLLGHLFGCGTCACAAACTAC